MLHTWEKQHPGRVETIFSGLMNVKPSHLMDPALFDFAGLELPPAGVTPADGDVAFDAEDFPDTSVIPLAPRKPL
jgi:tRNA 2-thiocytidine biosynthesis protein TtcA